MSGFYTPRLTTGSVCFDFLGKAASPWGALSNARACSSLNAGVVPSLLCDFGRFTPSTGLCKTAFCSQS